ncbi:glycine zipper 2TM domain-containing protein [Novosphingobium sp. BW1]
MKYAPILALATLSMALGACASDRYGRGGYGYNDRYGSSRGYRLGDNDRIYRARDGHYYCKRKDGTEGAIIGGLAGGVLGNLIAPDGSKTLGTLLGAGGGALAGREISRDDIQCR